MDQASEQYACSENRLSQHENSAYKGETPVHVVTTHFAVLPKETLAWHVQHDAVLSVQGACVWVTRDTSDIDYWLAHGETLALRQGERIWMSVEGDAIAEVALTARYGGMATSMSLSLMRLWEAAKRFAKPTTP